MIYSCEKCGKESIKIYGSGRFCSSKCSHARILSEEIKNKIRKSLKNRIVLNKRSRVDKICVICQKSFWVHTYNSKKIFCSRVCMNQDKDYKFKKKAAGGYREGSGYGKSGWYKGVQCDSSYELAWVIYHLEHNIEFIRNKQKFKYVYNEKEHFYIPDYFLPKDQLFIEVKGFSTEQHKAKIKCFNKQIKVLYKKDLKEIFEYVINKYGKNFIELYEGNPHKLRLNKCLVCNKPAAKQYCSQKCSGIGIYKIKARYSSMVEHRSSKPRVQFESDISLNNAL